MSTQTSQPPNNLPPPSADTVESSAGGRFLQVVFLLTRRALATLLFVLFLVCVYLSTAGLPQNLVQKWVSDLRARGIYVNVAGIYLDLLSGIAAEGFRFFDSPDSKIPMIEADRIILSFNPLDWFDREAGLTGLQIKGAALRINGGGKLESWKSLQNMTLDRVNARIRIEPGGVRIRRASASILGIHVESHGFLVRQEAKPGKKMTLEEFSRTLTDILHNLPSWLPSLFEQLNLIRFGEPPRADLNFTLNPTNPSLTEAGLRVRGFAAQIHGAAFDSWNLEARLENGRLTIPSLNLNHGAARCSLTASMNITNGITEIRLFSNLPLNHWLCLIPSHWSEALKGGGTLAGGRAMFEIWGGPAPFGKIAENLTGWLSIEEVDIQGVFVEKGFISFKRNGQDLAVKKVDAMVGQGSRRGALRGTGSFRLDTHEFAARGKTEFDPNAILSLLTRNQARIIHSLVFKQSPPSTQIEVSGDFDNPKQFQMKGHFRGTNFSFQGASVSFFDSDVTVSNGVMTFHPLLVVREEGRAEGLVAIDFDRETVELDATSTCDPYMVGRIIGPAAEKFLRTFRFEGAARVTAKGRVDYNQFKNTDLVASAEVQRAGILWLMTDQCRFDLRVLGTQLDFTNVVGSVYGGTFTGDATFSNIHSGTNVGYRIAGAVQDVDFGRLALAMQKVSGDPYKGDLSGKAAVSGILGTGTCGTVTGSGTISVRNGRLFQISLLGGLSQLLSRIYPGLGFASQTDFVSSFRIRNCKVHMDNAFLEGSVLSVSGQGDYSFNQTLNVNVQVQLLRAGLVASVIRAVTFPVTKLLEFNLSGTVEDPRWRPVNLPKELFLIFE
jgi:hypothetical protein